MTSRTIRRTVLSEDVAARIRKYIIEHWLSPGDRLPTEQEMAKLFGVNPITVREGTKWTKPQD